MRGKHILIGVTGGIAVYKAAYLVRSLVKAGADVKVMMTEAGTRFVSPLTFSTLTKNPVFTDLWSNDQYSDSDISTQHIDLANWADVIVIAPATANTIAKLAYGISDNLLTVVSLATTRPIILAPTMDAEMYLNAVTQKNLNVLKERGYTVIEPEKGELASGLSGPGRLPEVELIIKTVESVLSQSNLDLKNKKIVVTAGPTYEAIDPVRFISNRSSGKMGYAIANAAALRGANVTLISGPTQLETPRNVKRVDVESANDMLKAVMANSKRADVVVMAAAVADFTPAKTSSQKIKKQANQKEFNLTLKSTEDILLKLGKKKGKTVLVGFALETSDGISNAKKKLAQKNLDIIVLNLYSEKNRVFGSDFNNVEVIDRIGRKQKFSELSKFDIANKLLDKVKALL